MKLRVKQQPKRHTRPNPSDTQAQMGEDLQTSCSFYLLDIQSLRINLEGLYLFQAFAQRQGHRT